MYIEILSGERLKSFSNRIASSRKINATPEAITGVTNDFSQFVTLFNSITEYQTRILGHDIDKIEIIEEMVPFIQPKSVKYMASNVKCEELLEYPDEDLVNTNLSYQDLMDMMSNFRRLFKKDLSSGLVNLGSLKKCVSLSEIMDKASFSVIEEVKTKDGETVEVETSKVKYPDSPYIPTQLNDVGYYLFRSTYFNSDLNEVSNDFVSELKFV